MEKPLRKIDGQSRRFSLQGRTPPFRRFARYGKARESSFPVSRRASD